MTPRAARALSLALGALAAAAAAAGVARGLAALVLAAVALLGASLFLSTQARPPRQPRPEDDTP